MEKEKSNKKLEKSNKKKNDLSLGNELRKVQDIPLDRLSIQLGVEHKTARLIQNLIRGFLRKHGDEEGSHNLDRLIFFHKISTCKWHRLG